VGIDDKADKYNLCSLGDKIETKTNEAVLATKYIATRIQSE